jgi:hypothetical protein
MTRPAVATEYGKAHIASDDFVQECLELVSYLQKYELTGETLLATIGLQVVRVLLMQSDSDDISPDDFASNDYRNFVQANKDTVWSTIERVVAAAQGQTDAICTWLVSPLSGNA